MSEKTPILYESAYPGSMSEKSGGSYVRADDESSLAVSLLEMIRKLKQQNNQYRIDYIAPYVVDQLCDALTGWIKLHDDMIALGGDVKALTSEQIANFAVEQARLINQSKAALAKATEST